VVICSVTHNTIAMDGRHDLFLSVPTAHKHDPPYSTIPDRHYWPRDVTWRCYLEMLLQGGSENRPNYWLYQDYVRPSGHALLYCHSCSDSSEY
jgi:hypothetical protein